MALFLAGVDFEDNRIQGKDWPALKASSPFGALPYLDIEGHGRLAECNAILTFVGRNHGLHPADPWEAARHEALMSAAEHLRHKLSATNRLEEDDEKKAARLALVEGALPEFAKSVEAQLGDGPFVAGDAIKVVDVKLYMMVRWIVTGVIDHVPSTVFADYGKLTRLYEAVAAHPKIVEWLAR